MSYPSDTPSSPPVRSPSSQTSPPPQRSTPNRSSSYFTYPVSYAVSGILRRLNTETSPKSDAQSRSGSNSNRNSIGNVQSQLQSTASSLSNTFASLVSSTTSDMNAVFQPPHRIASPFQPPPLTPLSLKGWGGGMREKGKLLSTALAEEIRLLLPPRLQLVDEWKLAYSLEQNGVSLGTLYKQSEDYWGKRGGFVLVVKDGSGGIFGAYLSDAPRPSTSFYGNGECFLWRAHILHGFSDLQMNLPPPPSEDTTDAVRMTTISSPKRKGDSLAPPQNGRATKSGASTPERIRFKAFPYSGVNDYMIFCEHSYLSVGGGDGHYGLWLDDNLENGVSDTCPTFGNEPLSDDGKKFEVMGVELCIGNKIIRFKIPKLDRRFTVHEDLICRTSRFFEDRLQKHRKPISNSDECCVCAENLDATLKDISFCAKCGQNIHEVCIQAWKRSFTASVDEDSLPTCPMCRASWKNDPPLDHLDLKPGLDPEAVQTYLDWLYTSAPHIPSQISSSKNASSLVMLKLWTVANAIEDPSFKAKVIITYFTKDPIPFPACSLKWAFVERKRDDEIREFIIDLGLEFIKPGVFKKASKIWPGAFIGELADAAMVRWRDRGGPQNIEEDVDEKAEHRDGPPTKKGHLEKMAYAEKRVSVRKKIVIKYGRKIVRIEVADHEEFNIPKDLLCKRSKFFQKNLQPKRKPFSGDTECPICKATLEPGVNELTFCTNGCGHNFHYKCMEQWNTEKRENNQPVNCPCCRQSWPGDSKEITVHQYHDISPGPFSMFIEWLYHGHIAVEDLSDDSDDEEIAETPEPDLHELIEAYVIGLKLKSRTFCRDVLEGLLELTEETRIYPHQCDISLAYNNTTRCHWFKDGESIEYPTRFLQDLTIALLEKRPWERSWGLAEMEEKYVRGEVIAYGNLDGDEPGVMNDLSEGLILDSESDEEMGSQYFPILIG
ncbi:hypothetical protein GT037_000355 [Alternaria burnsii]|uniref:Oxidation resistance protein 1 n=1 Tax=Alternaria burnsii TaxID=1187904 RepID=A0A8H7BH55_9PLEO|nr:uncharacterized protein GT037_000355 [Alternaria burnsii]KAF7681379.1 hypothetical protein GT037_000355 [Alternaria burnsii]